jgi:hypothetical protein
MRDEDLDHVLSTEQEIIPSSGFVGSVMDAVRRETSAPPPIPFPWKRALPGLFAASCALVPIVAIGVEPFAPGAEAQPLPVQLMSAFALVLQVWKTIDASWIALTLILSLALVKFSTLFTSGQR